ncbi:MAG: hypothetical protein J7518_08860 [Nocardioidaceae bacterium]|nr:hypothetical protein [Nocardioidaceae bacterium]
MAVALAAVGMLVMSSGVAVMVAASPASAAKTPVNICHATSSDTNPYVFITVDDDSAKFEAHLAHRNSPNKKWKSDGTFNGVAHTAGQAKPDLIQGLDGNVTEATCNGEVTVAEAVADVDFDEPTCANENTASFDTTGEHVSFAVTDGSAAPGASIEVTATADENFTFEGGGTTQVFTHTFNAAETNCSVVPPPVVSPPVVEPPEVNPPEAEVVTPPAESPTVVHAGLAGARDTSQEGLTLLVAGMILMVIAAGLGTVRPRGGTRQS